MRRAHRLGLPVVASRGLGRFLLRVLFRTRVIGAEHVPKHGPVLLAGNHTGFLDGPIVFIVGPRHARILIKEEIYKGPLALFLRTIRQIPVRRFFPDRRALGAALETLAAGGVVGMYPEGTRGSGLVDHVYPGIGYIAVKTPSSPIVPVACFGSLDALPHGKWLPRLGARIDVVFGPAFQLSVPAHPHSRRAFGEAAEEIRRHLRTHLEQAAELTGRSLEPARRAA